MICVQAYDFIIRWNHYCSISVLVLYTYRLSILHSFKKSFPILFPMFHSVKFHKIDMVIGVTGFEPATSCSQSRRATKLRYTPLNVPYYSGGTTTCQEISLKSFSKIASPASVRTFLYILSNTDGGSVTTLAPYIKHLET